jgi:hypothetical protein
VSRLRPGRFSLSALISRGGDCINAGQRKEAKTSRLVASTSHSLVSSRLTPPGRAGPLRLEAMAGTGETDSVAEETGFELSVPVTDPSFDLVRSLGTTVKIRGRNCSDGVVTEMGF